MKALGTLEVSPNFMIMDNGMGRIPVEREGTVLMWLQGPQPAGCVHQDCGDRSLKHKLSLGLGT